MLNYMKMLIIDRILLLVCESVPLLLQKSTLTNGIESLPFVIASDSSRPTRIVVPNPET